MWACPVLVACLALQGCGGVSGPVAISSAVARRSGAARYSGEQRRAAEALVAYDLAVAHHNGKLVCQLLAGQPLSDAAFQAAVRHCEHDPQADVALTPVPRRLLNRPVVLAVHVRDDRATVTERLGGSSGGRTFVRRMRLVKVAGGWRVFEPST